MLQLPLCVCGGNLFPDGLENLRSLCKAVQEAAGTVHSMCDQYWMRSNNERWVGKNWNLKQ